MRLMNAEKQGNKSWARNALFSRMAQNNSESFVFLSWHDLWAVSTFGNRNRSLVDGFCGYNQKIFTQRQKQFYCALDSHCKAEQNQVERQN